MAKFVSTKTNFSSGKLSDKLLGRPDIKEYANGMSISENASIDPSGGAYKRSSFVSVNQTTGDVGGYQLTPIRTEIVSPLYGYEFLLQWHNLPTSPTTTGHWFDVYRLEENGQATYITGTTLLSWTNGDEPYDAAGYCIASLNNSFYITHCSGQLFPAIVTFFNPSSVAITGLPTPRAFPHTTPVSPQFYYDRTIESLICDNANVAAQIQNKTLSVVQNSWGYPQNGSFSVCRTTVDTGTAVGNNVPIISPEPGIIFNLADYGPYFMVEDYPDQAFIADWGPGNWPFACCAFQGRLFFLGSPLNPDKVWGSRINTPWIFNYDSYYNIDTPAPSIVESDHLTFTISGLVGARIQTAATVGRGICVGSTKGMSMIQASDAAISPFDFNIQQINSIPIGCVQPAQGDQYAIFASENRKSVILAVPDDVQISFTAIDLSSQIGELQSPISNFSWNPYTSVCTIVTEPLPDFTTKTYNLTIKKQTDCIALSELTLEAGDLLAYSYWKNGIDYIHVSESLYDGRQVERMITANAETVEEITRDNLGAGPSLGETLDNVVKFAYTDFPYASSEDHRESEVLSVPLPFNYFNKEIWVMTMIDTDPQGFGSFLQKTAPSKFQVNGYGKILGLTEDYDRILIGIPYKFHIATMPIESGAQWGTAQLGLKRIDKIGLWYYNSTTFTVSSDGYNEDEVTIDGTETGRKEVAFPASSEYDQRVHIIHEGLGPCHITSLSMRGVSNDG